MDQSIDRAGQSNKRNSHWSKVHCKNIRTYPHGYFVASFPHFNETNIRIVYKRTVYGTSSVRINGKLAMHGISHVDIRGYFYSVAEPGENEPWRRVCLSCWSRDRRVNWRSVWARDSASLSRLFAVELDTHTHRTNSPINPGSDL